MSEEHTVFYVCPSCGAKVDSGVDPEPAPEHEWKLMFFKHTCPECGSEHDIWRPEEEPMPDLRPAAEAVPEWTLADIMWELHGGDLPGGALGEEDHRPA